MLRIESISFRKLQEDDFPLLHTWLNEPHVHEWYEKDKQNTLEEVIDDYSKDIKGEEPSTSYIALYENKPVGYMQTYKVNDWPTYADAVGYDTAAAAIDAFIGNPAFMGKGFGGLMIKKFLKDVVFSEEGITKCFIDPEPDNKRAIKSYEKVGFRYIKTLQIQGEPELAYLMEIKKEDLKIEQQG